MKRQFQYLSRFLIVILIGWGCISFGWSQSYPSKSIRLIVPFPPGGPTDIVARPLAMILSEQLKEQIFIENKGGAGGSIAADFVAKSPADGYVLLMGTVGTNAINGNLYKNISYDMVKDFTPLALIAHAPLVITVNASSQIKTLAGLAAQAKAQPETIAYGSAGNGSPGHLTGALFETAAQVKLRHIPYKGSAPAVTDLISGQIPLMFDPIQSVLPHLQSGKLRALAVTGKMRSPLIPDVPTVAEQGYPQFESTAWWAVFGPAKLPEKVTHVLKTNIETIVASPAYKERLGNLGVLPNDDFKESLANFQVKEITKWSKVIRESGASVD